MSKITVPLKHPIKAHGQDVKELTFEEPTLGALDDCEIVVKGDGSVRLNLGDMHRIIANMANIPPSAAKTIRLSDMAPIGKAVMGFMSELFLPTGES